MMIRASIPGAQPASFSEAHLQVACSRAQSPSLPLLGADSSFFHPRKDSCGFGAHAYLGNEAVHVMTYERRLCQMCVALADDLPACTVELWWYRMCLSVLPCRYKRHRDLVTSGERVVPYGTYAWNLLCCIVSFIRGRICRQSDVAASKTRLSVKLVTVSPAGPL